MENISCRTLIQTEPYGLIDDVKTIFQIPDSSDGEVPEIKNQLREVEGNQLFSRDSRNHVFRRQAKEDELDDLISDESEIYASRVEILEDTVGVHPGEEKVELSEESRGWKNGKKKNKDKKNKKNKKKIEGIIELEEEYEEYEDEIQKNEELKEKEAKLKVMTEEETEVVMKEEVDAAPFTNGLQFSAYSAEARPVYSPAEERIEPDENMFLQYGLDLQGKPQYMDKAVVNMLLQNPQAKRVNITTLKMFLTKYHFTSIYLLIVNISGYVGVFF